MLKKLTWLGHAGFFYAGPPRVYIDPFRIGAGPTADLVLLTHPHYDHCSPAALEPIVGADTEILCPPDCLTALSRLPGSRRIVSRTSSGSTPSGARSSRMLHEERRSPKAHQTITSATIMLSAGSSQNQPVPMSTKPPITITTEEG